MKTYIGTKIVDAKPMTRGEYNELRGWVVPSDENPADPGYLVSYHDGGAKNHPGFDGYISWSPKLVFEGAYRITEGLTFGQALESLKGGKRIARAGWNGKGMWLKYIPRYHWETTKGVELLEGLPWIGIKTTDDCFVPWLASQTDMLASDWMIVND